MSVTVFLFFDVLLILLSMSSVTFEMDVPVYNEEYREFLRDKIDAPHYSEDVQNE